MRFRSLKTLSRPVVEPVSLAEAKSHCRVDGTQDDGYIQGLISSAREWVESYMDETIIHTQYVMKLDQFPAEITLPRPPMATAGTTTAVAITYTVDSSGQTATLSTSQYRVDRDSMPGTLRPLYGEVWPPHLMDYNSITVTWWGGRHSDASDVPQRIKTAILWLVGMWYERRMAADQVSLSEIPFGVKSLLDSVKWGGYQ